MPYLSSDHLRRALTALQELMEVPHAVALFMMYHDVPVGGVAKYGVVEDRAVMTKYFRPSGGPPDKPFYMPLGKDGGKKRWRADSYFGKTLQKLRSKDYIQHFVHPNSTKYGLKPTFGEIFGDSKIPLVYLAIWCFREEAVASLEDAVSKTAEIFRIKKYGLLGTHFETTVPTDLNSLELRDEPLATEEISALIGAGTPAKDPQFLKNSLVEKISGALQSDRVIHQREMVAQIVDAWLSRDVVVLVGAPGTGKSTLAHALARAVPKALSGWATSQSFSEQVTPEYDQTRLLGYENLSGTFVPSPFTRHVLVDPESRYAAVVLVLDEWNLARIDEYLALPLAALESQEPFLLPGKLPEDLGEGEVTAALPTDTLIIATCNSYLDEPESRTPLSNPVKRRSVIFEMPNLLALQAKATSVEAALVEYGQKLLQREKETVSDRFANSQHSPLDYFRRTALEQVSAFADLPESVCAAMTTVFTELFASGTAQRAATLGVYKDMLANVAYAGSEDQASETALCRQLAGRLFHLLNGEVDLLARIAKAVEPLKGSELVFDAARRYEEIAAEMGTPGRLIPLV